MHLRASPVVVQTCEAGEVLFRDGGSTLGCNQTVGVGRISYNQHLKKKTKTNKMHKLTYFRTTFNTKGQTKFYKTQ